MAKRISSNGERTLGLLSAAGPGFATVRAFDRWHGDHARADLRGRTVQYAYVFQTLEPQVALHLYPADTLTQARALYTKPHPVERLLALRERGWRLQPNFHFGFMEKGLTWTRSLLDVEVYAAYWTEHISGLGAYRRDSWEEALKGLIAAGVFDPRDVPQFRIDFIGTGRAEATPRPGLCLSRTWQYPGAVGEPLIQEMRGALEEALRALGEHVALEVMSTGIRRA